MEIFEEFYNTQVKLIQKTKLTPKVLDTFRRVVIIYIAEFVATTNELLKLSENLLHYEFIREARLSHHFKHNGVYHEGQIREIGNTLDYSIIYLKNDIEYCESKLLHYKKLITLIAKYL